MAYGRQPGYGRPAHGGQEPYGHPGYGPAGQPYGQSPGQPHGQPYGPPPQQYAPPQYAPPQYAPPRRRPEVPTGGPVSDQDERWAVPAYVGMFVTGFVAPAVVLALRGHRSHFVRFHATQALNLFVVMFLFTFTALLLAYLKGPTWLLLVLLVLAADSFCVIKAAIGANRCEWYRLPALVAWRIFR
jgi:uncharacterized membrane protein